MYADKITDSMRKAISETNRRRQIQNEYNEANGIVPKTIVKSVRDVIRATKVLEENEKYITEKDPESMDKKELEELFTKVTKEMKKAASDLNFELAASLRDQLIELKTFIGVVM